MQARVFLLFAALLATCAIEAGCHSPPAQPVTIGYLDLEWSHDNASERRIISEHLIQKFEAETGIRVNHLPAPETTSGQLALILQLLKQKDASADVYAIDVIWPGILGDYLADLKPEFAGELGAQDPGVLENYTARGRLVAMPYHTNVGVLYYRSDLMAEYGYTKPPRTWDELESMSKRIQAGERAKGNKEFWGYVFPGAASEGLVCDGLEWQFDDGGGRIIEPDATISVNNPQTIKTWQRARRWIGSISSPSVLSYQEWDALNAIVHSGRAAFGRVWTSDYFLSKPALAWMQQQMGVTALPSGTVHRSETLGGIGLAMARNSRHPVESMKLIRFLLREEANLEAERTRNGAPKYPQLYDLPSVLKAYAPATKPGMTNPSVVLSRPSTVTGAKYNDVASAYARTLHSVLAGTEDAAAGAANLEKELSSITGFGVKQPSVR